MDLKSDNILIVGPVSSTQLPWVKIGDVGMGLWRSQRTTEVNTAATWERPAHFPWRAPEMHQWLAAPPVDMYAYAGLVVEVARGTRLTQEDVMRHRQGDRDSAVVAGTKFSSPMLRPKSGEMGSFAVGVASGPVLRGLVQGLLAEAPEARPTATDVAAHLAVGCAWALQEYKEWLENGELDAASAVGQRLPASYGRYAQPPNAPAKVREDGVARGGRRRW
eukprot:CAMPEP_0204504544 /NCGR_PEP_ID=MMETSP0471-20130131/105721_1 /ASSEMBLY_ACC=CAM_ASM_000602 /TAXON_ID=2969 /ORGANISM="Oxyrrhis marina" /LENGTH=219 /DNA_ID=CAMNT_0051509429 /DNA_START=1 /DNA_END=658 /DNA_ORIENTATION=+